MKSVQDFILERIFITPFGCWEWLVSLDKDGYAKGTWSRTSYRIARLSFETFRRKIDPGLVVDHLCRNRRCVNPWHLEPVTNRVNLHRGHTAARLGREKTHCLKGHPFDGLNTRWKVDGTRACRMCHCLWARKYRAMRRENPTGVGSP